MHWHVGRNISGNSPEGDIACFDNMAGAVDFLRHEIRSQQGDYEQLIEDPEDDNDPWADVANSCVGVLGAIAEGDTGYKLTKDHTVRYVFSPPVGPDVAYWAEYVTRPIFEHCAWNKR